MLRIAGSTHVGNYVTIAAQCGITGHIKIADKVVVAARSGVMNNLASRFKIFRNYCATFKRCKRSFSANFL